MDLEVVPVQAFDGRLSDAALEFAPADRDAIDARWREASARNPHLFDGRILLADRVAVEDGRLKARFVETGFSTFLWRRSEGALGIGLRNVFGAAAVFSCDGAALVGRMSSRTSNAGQIYFPAGTPDLDDVAGSSVELERSIERELLEETGLDRSVARPTERRVAVFADWMVACVRRFDSDLTAVELLARVEAHIAADARPEFDAAFMVRSADDLTEASPPYVRAALAALIGLGR